MLTLPLVGFGWCCDLKGRETVGPIIFHLGCDPGPAMPSSQSLPIRTAVLGPRLLGPCVGDRTWRAAMVGPLPEEVTEAPGSGKLHPWVPLGLVGSRNNTQMDFFEAGTWKAFFKASGWVSAWVLIISDCSAILLSDNTFRKGVLCSDRMLNVIF